MLENTSARKKRRLIILKGISQDLKHSEISAQLGANRGGINSDIKLMRRIGDLGLIQAERAQVLVREEKAILLKEEKGHFKQNKRFLSMTGISLQEKSFRNMIDFNKFDLMNVLKSENQHVAIVKLPKSIKKSLKRNGIITKRWQDNEITLKALDYLTS
jgi:hypothetical protein